MINTIDYTSQMELDGNAGSSYYGIGIEQTSICALHDNYYVVVFNDSTNHNLYIDLLLYSTTNKTFSTVKRTMLKSGVTLIHPTVKKLDSNNIVVAGVQPYSTAGSPKIYNLFLLKVEIDSNNNITVIYDNSIIRSYLTTNPDIYYYSTPEFGLDVIDSSTVSILFGESFGYKYMNYIYNVNGTQLASFEVQSSVGYWPKVTGLGNGYYLLAYTNLTSGTYSYVMSFYFNSSTNSITHYNTATITHVVQSIGLTTINSTRALIAYKNDVDGHSYARVISVDASHNAILNSEYQYETNSTFGNTILNIDNNNFAIAFGIIGQQNVGHLSIVTVSGNSVLSKIDSSYDGLPYSGNIEFCTFGMVNLESGYLTLVKAATQDNTNHFGLLSVIHFYDSTSSTNNHIKLYTSSSFKDVKEICVYSSGSWHIVKDANIFSSGSWKNILVPDVIPPSVPTNLSASNMTDSSFTLSWTASTDYVGVTGYKVYKDGVFYGSTSSTSLSITDLLPNTGYTMTVSAYDAANNESAQSSQLNVTTDDAAVCFVEGTQITLPNGAKEYIENLSNGEFVHSEVIDGFNDTNDVKQLHSWQTDRIVKSKIDAKIKSVRKETDSHTIIINDGLIETTPLHNHLVKHNNIWKFTQMMDIVEGDYLLNDKNEEVQITKISHSYEKKIIYPLLLEKNHIFYANGILTHNAKGF